MAATGPSLQILRVLLASGASVHLRNHARRTPMFLAANTGLQEYVSLLRECGAHLHEDELAKAWLLAQAAPDVWRLTGISC